MKDLIEVDYIDGQVLAFTDGEVLEMIYKGSNRMGKSWDLRVLEHEGSTTSMIVKEPTHKYGESEYECIVFKNRDKFKFWQEVALRRLSRDILESLGDYDTAKIVQATIAG